MAILSAAGLIGWVLLGAATTAVLVTFWDQIRGWLNNVAATVYTKKDPLDKYFVKTDIVAKAPVNKIDNGVLEEIKKQGVLVQEFEYRG